MDWEIIIYSTFLWLGLGGLYSLRNMSILGNFFSMGPIIGFATLIQKLTVRVGLLAFFIVSIINSKWYTPFGILLIGFVFSVIIGRIMYVLKLMQISTQKSEFGMLISALMTLISLLLMLLYYF